MPNTASPSSAREDYLKAIFHLGLEGTRATTSALAERLGVRDPSVSAMLKRLAADGLVHHIPRNGATLTDAGHRACLQVIRRHRLLETFLVEILGLDWSEVHDEAEVLEHHLSERIVDAMDHVLGHPGEDPHGRPIPDADGGLPVRDLLPLAEMREGERGTVREVRAEEAGRLQRWKQLGLVPGTRLHMRRRQEGVETQAFEMLRQIDKVPAARSVVLGQSLELVRANRRGKGGHPRLHAETRSRKSAGRSLEFNDSCDVAQANRPLVEFIVVTQKHAAFPCGSQFVSLQTEHGNVAK